VRFAAAIRPRARDLRRGHAILRLALSAVLSLRRRRSGVDALWPGAGRLAGGHARPLSAGDPRHPIVIPGRAKREPGIHNHGTARTGAEHKLLAAVVMDSGSPLRGFRNDGRLASPRARLSGGAD